jgi:hypothetical protein
MITIFGDLQKNWHFVLKSNHVVSICHLKINCYFIIFLAKIFSKILTLTPGPFVCDDKHCAHREPASERTTTRRRGQTVFGRHRQRIEPAAPA